MTTIDERKAELDAKLEAIFKHRKPKPPKPKLITSDGDIIRDAKVRVSVDDPNAKRRGSEEVVVTRPDPQWLGSQSPIRPGTVRVNLDLADRQRAEREVVEAQDRQFHQALRGSDPMGIWTKDEDR